MPSINGGMKLVKYLLFLFNLACVVIGIILIWTGVSVKYGFSQKLAPLLKDGDDGGYSLPPTIFIALGAILFLIAFLGCCGAVTENHCMMMLYSVLLGLILVIQIGAAIAAYAFQDDFENALATGMEASIPRYYDDSVNPELRNATIDAWNMVQNTYECCGVHNYTDWHAVKNAPADNFVPTFCCIGGAHDLCTQGITAANIDDTANAAKFIYTRGCATAVAEQLSITHMGTIGIVLAVVQALAILCACMMARSIRFSYETV